MNNNNDHPQPANSAKQNPLKKLLTILGSTTLISMALLGLSNAPSLANFMPNLISQGTNVINNLQSLPNILDNFLTSGSGLVSSIKKEIQGYVNIDFSQLTKSIKTALNPSETSETTANEQRNQILENKPLGSYELEQDKRKQQTIESAYQYINQNTFSEQAQQQQKELTITTSDNVAANQQLSQDSQNSDVSQHILQNISEQLALIGEQNSALIIQQQKQQNDSALTNTLLTQQAEEMRQQNNKNRQEMAATSNLTSRQIGLLRPAGLPLDDNPSVQSNNQNQPLKSENVFTGN